ncbi:hypothetical protein PI125_g11065 [Phytophthora idaei]|nr:hypothetical protein PI125_g11065 [Phytophthora idaei]
MDELSATQPRSREPTISTLKTYYGDEALSQVINAAQKNPSTQTLATELQTRQLQYWLNDRRAPADVLKLLGLTKTGDNLFDNPQFVTWLIYVADYNSKNSRKAIPRISILTSNYGDDALSKMVVEAKKTSSTATIAAKLQAEQIQHWLDIQKSPGDVFKFLALNKAGDKLLDNPQFSAWVKYVDDLNKANIDEKTTLMSVLATHYNSEGLVNILKAATNVPASSKVVKRLKTEQKWLTKDTLDELFKRLKLDKAGNDVLINPQLKTWISYMKEYNMANPKYQTTLIGTLVKNYGDENLAKILEAATKVKSMASTAKILQNEQFQLWMKKGWSPNAIFNVLHLDKAGDKLLSNPLVVTWNKYLSAFNWENPDKKTTLWEILKYHDYSDDSVGVSTCSSEKDSGY